MKIRFVNSILIIEFLTILLVLAITFIPSNPIRIVLGLPFILFFPGYTLVCALFPKRGGILGSSRLHPDSSSTDPDGYEDRAPEGMDGIERIALSFGLSIAIVALIGLGLNYSPWGIRLEPVLYSVSIFIFVMSIIALIRRSTVSGEGITTEINIRLPGWEGSALNKTLTLVLAVAVVGALGTLGYVVAAPKVGEKFTEFYILGLNGKAESYPSEFTLTNGKVSAIKYGDLTGDASNGFGRVTVGIINQEQEQVSYQLEVKIDGATVNFNYNGQMLSRLSSIELAQGLKWEGEIAFAPQHTGDNQKVEFLLYKGSGTESYRDLHLWVNVK